MDRFSYNEILCFFLLIPLFLSCNNTVNNEVNKNSQKIIILNESNFITNSLIFNRDTMNIHDPKNPTEFELQHIPEIIVKGPDENDYAFVEIKVGSKGHILQCTTDHWIDHITLYANDTLLGTCRYTNTNVLGYAVFKIKIEEGMILKAECGCNQHGIWTKSLEL